MGRAKALIVGDGQTLVGAAAAALTEGGCAPVAVVTGAEAGAVGAAVPPGSATLYNPRWRSGMASSVRTALGWAAAEQTSAVVILPVDTPGIGPAVIRRLAARWRDGGAPTSAAVVATYGGEPRNPVLIGRDRYDDIGAGMTGDSGARHWLRTHSRWVIPVACDDIGDPTDLDTPADLARWRSDRSSARDHVGDHRWN